MNELAKVIAAGRAEHVTAVIRGEATTESLFDEYTNDRFMIQVAEGDCAVHQYEQLMQQPLLELGRAKGVHV